MTQLSQWTNQQLPCLHTCLVDLMELSGPRLQIVKPGRRVRYAVLTGKDKSRAAERDTHTLYTLGENSLGGHNSRADTLVGWKGPWLDMDCVAGQETLDIGHSKENR